MLWEETALPRSRATDSRCNIIYLLLFIIIIIIRCIIIIIILHTCLASYDGDPGSRRSWRLGPRRRRGSDAGGRRRHCRALQYPRVLCDLLDGVPALDARLQDAVDQAFHLVADTLRPREANLALRLVLDHLLHVRVVVRHRTTDLRTSPRSLARCHSDPRITNQSISQSINQSINPGFLKWPK